MGCRDDSASHCGASNCQYYEYFGRYSNPRRGPRGSSRNGIGLADGDAGDSPLRRRCYAHLQISLHVIRVETMGYSPALGIAHDSQSPRTVGKDAAGSVIGKQENHRRAGHRLMIFVLYLDNGLARRPLADIVNGSITFDNDQV